jgi:RimJ/RimL family protein N-acetyltransferase
MIYGKRLRLRAPERADIPRFVAWLNDPEVIAGLAIHLPMGQAEEENWFEGMLKRPPAEHPLTMEIRQGEGWLPIGNIGLMDIDWRNRSAEVGILIGEKAYWNQGYGREAMQMMLKHGFETLNLNRIFLRVYETNPRAVRSYEQAGFVHEGRQRQAEHRQGKYCDVLMMSVLRSEWEIASAVETAASQ